MPEYFDLQSIFLEAGHWKKFAKFSTKLSLFIRYFLSYPHFTVCFLCYISLIAFFFLKLRWIMITAAKNLVYLAKVEFLSCLAVLFYMFTWIGYAHLILFGLPENFLHLVSFFGQFFKIALFVLLNFFKGEEPELLFLDLIFEVIIFLLKNQILFYFHFEDSIFVFEVFIDSFAYWFNHLLL